MFILVCWCHPSWNTQHTFCRIFWKHTHTDSHQLHTISDNAHWAFIFTVNYGTPWSHWLCAQMWVCVRLKVYMHKSWIMTQTGLCVCVFVCWIELWHCTISLTSPESHSSQLNHGNRLYGQNAVLAMCVWACRLLQDFLPACVCVWDRERPWKDP